MGPGLEAQDSFGASENDHDLELEGISNFLEWYTYG